MFSFDFVKNKQQQQEENTAYLVNMGEGAWGQKGKDVVLARQELISSLISNIYWNFNLKCFSDKKKILWALLVSMILLCYVLWIVGAK